MSRAFMALTAALLALPTLADSRDLRDLAPKTKISLGQAIQAALKAQPGAAVSAELEDEGEGKASYEVMIVAEDGLHEVEVSATDGALIENERETGKKAKRKLRAMSEVLRHSELDLAALIGKAEELVRGRSVEAEFELEDGQPVCEVTLVNSRYFIEVEVEARAGHVIELEMERDLLYGDDDGDDDDHGDGDDDDNDDDDDDDHDHDRDHADHDDD